MSPPPRRSPCSVGGGCQADGALANPGACCDPDRLAGGWLRPRWDAASLGLAIPRSRRGCRSLGTRRIGANRDRVSPGWLSTDLSEKTDGGVRFSDEVRAFGELPIEEAVASAALRCSRSEGPSDCSSPRVPPLSLPVVMRSIGLRCGAAPSDTREQWVERELQLGSACRLDCHEAQEP